MVEHTRVCRVCSVEQAIESFPLQHNGRHRTECRDCGSKRRRAYRLAPRACAQCGQTFRPKDPKYSTYCTSLCGIRYQQEQRWIGKTCPSPWHDCSECGRQFYSRAAGVLTCSKVCLLDRGRRARGAPSKGRTHQCRQCGRVSGWKGNGRPPEFCSRRCGKKAVGQMRRARQRSVAAYPIRRHWIFERDGWICQLCGGPIDPSLVVPDPMSPTLDHVTPIARGGAHSEANLQAAHFECNWRKGA